MIYKAYEYTVTMKNNIYCLNVYHTLFVRGNPPGMYHIHECSKQIGNSYDNTYFLT